MLPIAKTATHHIPTLNHKKTEHSKIKCLALFTLLAMPWVAAANNLAGRSVTVPGQAPHDGTFAIMPESDVLEVKFEAPEETMSYYFYSGDGNELASLVDQKLKEPVKPGLLYHFDSRYLGSGSFLDSLVAKKGGGARKNYLSL